MSRNQIHIFSFSILLKMSVSFPPPPTPSTTSSCEDVSTKEEPSNRKGPSSEPPGPMFDGFMKLYAILSFTVFVAVVFAREATLLVLGNLDMSIVKNFNVMNK